MDCVFNKLIPESTLDRIILRPTSKTWVNGIAHSYSEDYPIGLEAYMTEDEFLEAIGSINDSLNDLWPCLLCYCIGYSFCLCTLCLSFLPTYMCIAESKTEAEKAISKVNSTYKSRNMSWHLVLTCSTSWIEIKLN